MSTREERQRKLAEIREATQDAVLAHTMSDDESALAALAAQVGDEPAMLRQLEHDDPLWWVMFGDRDDNGDER